MLERVASGSRILNLALVLTELSEALLLVGRVDEASALAGPSQSRADSAVQVLGFAE